jgi:hypothetical protein
MSVSSEVAEGDPLGRADDWTERGLGKDTEARVLLLIDEFFNLDRSI